VGEGEGIGLDCADAELSWTESNRMMRGEEMMMRRE
jgi:hypothetical protein